MAHLIRAFCIFLLLISTGCLWHKDKPRTIVEQRPSYDIDKSHVINADVFKRAKTIAVVPFNPGPDIPANEELDRISLMIVKGVVDTVNEQSEHIRVLVDQDVGSAELILEGHITAITKASLVKTLLLKGQQQSVAVKGRLIDRTTGDPVLVFTDTKVALDQNEDAEKIAERIGRSVGQFIVLSAKEQGTDSF